MTTEEPKPFLEELEKAETKPELPSLYLWRKFLDAPDVVFDILNDDSKFPWDLKPKLFGETLNQHAYLFKRNKAKNKEMEGLVQMEQLCQAIEARFDVEVFDCFCNRFQDATHDIVWHSDTYGSHIFVVTLGSERNIQFCPKKKKKTAENVVTVRPGLGDIYFMPLSLNKTHVHQVCQADAQSGDAARISLVFFAEQPKYAGKQFKITVMDRIRGAFESMME